MATRTQFHVVPSGNNWEVKHNGKVLTTHFTKTAAIDKGVAYAKAYQPSELFIHRTDGTIEDRRTYGSDPYPPAG